MDCLYLIRKLDTILLIKQKYYKTDFLVVFSIKKNFI